MPLGLRLPSGVRGDWGLDSVPDEVDESSVVKTVSSQPLSVSPKVGRMETYVNESERDLRTPPLPLQQRAILLWESRPLFPVLPLGQSFIPQHWEPKELKRTSKAPH